MKTAFLTMVLFVVFSAALQAAPDDKPLSLRECEEIAIKNQPSLTVAQQGVAAAQGRETQARSPLFPQVTASTGYSESVTDGGAFGASVTKTYATTLQLNQIVYDFGRTGNAVDAARWNTRSSDQDRERTSQEVILNVKQAYYALLAFKYVVEVTQKQVAQTESHLAQAQAFFNAGSKPRFDVTRAEVEVNNARLNLINAKNNVRIKTMALNNAMGIDPGRATDIVRELPPVPEIPSPAQAQEDSLKNRPELMKMEADIESARARVRAEEANYFPTLSINGAYNWATGTQDLGTLPIPIPGVTGRQLVGDIGNSWNAGIVLSIPLFQGGVTKGRVSETRANLIALEAQRSSVIQSVLLEVNQSYADLENALARIEAMESALQKARESLELAQGRYEAGIGPSLEVTDAQLAASQAELDHIQAKYDYRLAAARLFKAMGKATIE